MSLSNKEYTPPGEQQNANQKKEYGQKNCLSMVMAMDGWQRPCDLLEVLSVRPLTFDGDKEIYGRIEIWNYSGYRDVIYDRSEHHRQLLLPGDLLALNGPKEKAVNGDDVVCIQFDIMDMKQKFAEIALPFYLCSTDWKFVTPSTYYELFFSHWSVNKIRRRELMTTCGLFEVKYVYYEYALQATVRLSLANWKGRKGKVTAKVCGKVVAFNSLLRECAKIVLFESFLDDEPLTVTVGPTADGNELIPLLRPVAVVPSSSSSFKVAVDMCLHHDDDDYDSNNFTIARNAASFPSQLSGEVQQSISGELGDVQVTVTWSYRKQIDE